MERGYVKLWRKTLDSGLLQSPTAWQVFGYLLMKVTHKKIRILVGTSPVELEAGQVVTGRKAIAFDCKLSEQNVRTALSLLEKLEIITIKSTNKYSVISFVKWDIYQQECPTNQPTNQPTLNQQVAKNQPTSNQEITNTQPTLNHKQEHKNINTEEHKNINTEEKKASVRTRGAAAAYSDEFEAFWTAYPRKEGKGKAWESWQKLKNLIPDDVCERVQRAARCDQWQKDGGQFIPHPTTWLNQRRWDDEMCQKPKSTLAPWQIRENEMEAMIQQLVFKKFPDIDYFYMTDEQTDYCMELRDLSYEELLELCSAA